MKKFFSKFLKDTRGVVMMEYIILGCFCAGLTILGVMALGKVYNNGFVTMGLLTLGETATAVSVNDQAESSLLVKDTVVIGDTYAAALAKTKASADASIVDFPHFQQ